MKTYTIVLLAGCTLIASSLNAQTAKKKPVAAKDTLIQRDLVLEREYEPTVQPADKLPISPDLETMAVEKQPLAFSISESPTPVTGDYNPLPVAGIEIPYPAARQFGFIRLGVGTHRSFLGDAQFNLINKKEQALDLNVQHRSVFGDVVNTNEENVRAYSNKNNLRASYKAHMENAEFDAYVSEKYNAWNYYGSWRAIPLPANALLPPDGQWSSDAEFGVGVKSKDIGQVFSWNVHAEGHRFRLGKGVQTSDISTDQIGGRESEFRLKADINYDINELFHLGVNAGMRGFSYRNPISLDLDGSSQDHSIDHFEKRQWFEFAPFGRMTYKRWLLTAGLKLSIPTLQTEKVRPNIIATGTTPLGEVALLKVKLDGGVLPMSYREGFELNPFIDPSIRLKSAWKVLDLSGQIDFRPVTSLRLSPMVGYDVTKDMAFFYNASPLNEGLNKLYGSLFDVKYMNSNRFRAGINALYTFRSFFTLQGEIYYNQYLNYSSTKSIDDQLKANGRKAWYRPGLEMHVRADFTPMEELNLFVDLRQESIRYGSTQTEFSAKLEGINNVSLGANYKLTKDVALFLSINNLLDQRSGIWNGYAVHGMTGMIGGSVKF